MDFLRGLFKDPKQEEADKLVSLNADLNNHFPVEHIRVLVYKDGCRLLYDSQAVHDPHKKPSGKAREDMFGEMMLGAVPLALDGISTKVHHFADSSQILISKLFCIIQKRRVSNLDDEDDPEERRRSTERSKTTTGTPATLAPSSAVSPRRSSVSASAYSVKPQRTTYALGVVFTYSTPLQFAMLHTHFPLIDMRIKKVVRALKNSLESRFTSNSYGSQRISSSRQIEAGGSISRVASTHLNQTNDLKLAVGVFQHAIQTLFCAPRLEYPIWSAVSTATKGRTAAYTLFLNALKTLDSWDDTRSNGFLSTLITGILTNNLSWVRFLDLSDLYITPEAKKYLDRNRSNISAHQNPMMWQLEDLFGFFTSNCNINRTVLLCEKGTTCVNEVLLVCSYFMRCTQIFYPSTPDSPGKLYPEPENDELASSSDSSLLTTPSSSSNNLSSNTSTPASSSKSPQHPNGRPLLSEQDANESWLGYNSAGFVENSLPYAQNFAYSLYGGLYAGYVADMALLATSLTRDTVIPQVLADMHTWMDHPPFCTKVHSATCILANLSSRNCEVLTYCPSPSQSSEDLDQTLDSAWFSSVPQTVNREITTEPIERAEYITSTLSSVRELWLLGIPPETCIMFLEDRLRNVYIRSLSLLRQLEKMSLPSRLTFNEAADLIGCGTSPSDVHLFVSLLQGILLSSSFSVSTLREIGTWWVLVEAKAQPSAPPDTIEIAKLSEEFVELMPSRKNTPAKSSSPTNAPPETAKT
eukprot:Phypoly_transcript_03541.p1 GENE.Phypoly_transcript_03541~~Phypoly_transcript_03541.p1  ORF type:complete len:782 (+),score=103.15 Phypoly_transcript_03541:88-2346(+)